MKTFSGADLGDCSSTSFSSESTFNVTFHHPSTDAWNGDWIKIFSQGQHVTCYLNGVVLNEVGDDTLPATFTTNCSCLNGYKHFPSTEAIGCLNAEATPGSCDGTFEDCIEKGFEMCNDWSGCLGIQTHPRWMAANKSPQLCRPVSPITKLEKPNNWDFYVKCDAVGDPCRQTLTGWTEFEGNCYEYHEDKKTWTQAQAVCDKGQYRYKGVLAAASSPTRNNFISTSFTSDRLWIGGFRNESSGLWQWTDGSAWNYTSWATSPVQQPSGDGPYIDSNQFGSGLWNDRLDSVVGSSSDHDLTFVCQYPTLY